MTHKLTKKQVDLIQELNIDKHLETVTKGQYKRASTNKQDNTVCDILDVIFDTKVTRMFGCGQCVYKLYEKLATLYYNTIKENNASNGTGNTTDGGNSTKEERKEKRKLKQRTESLSETTKETED